MGYRLITAIQASDIAKNFGFQLIGDDVEIQSVAALSDMQPKTLGFSKNDLPEGFPGQCLIVGAGRLAANGVSVLSSDAPRLDFMRVLEKLAKNPGFILPKDSPKIHETAQVSKNAVIGKGVTVGKNTRIGNFVVINDGVQIGDNCVIKSGAVIGEDGFGFERDESGIPIRFHHLGSVRIGNNVEIGSLTTVCRGTLSDTLIDDGAKIDDHVHIAHNCKIGRNVFVIACAEVSGGVVLEEGVWVGPSASVIQQLRIGRDAFIGIAANVLRDVDAGMTMIGNPAKPLRRNS